MSRRSFQPCNSHQLRQLFVTILAFCSPKDPLQLFTKFQSQLCDDYAYQLRDQSPHDGLLRDLAFRDIEVSLSAMKISLETFQLPSIDTNFNDFLNLPLRIDRDLPQPP